MSTTTMDALTEIGENIRTQNNRATAAPMFVVQQRRRIYGMDPDYSEHHVWVDGCNDHTVADERRARALDRMHERGEKIDGCWTRTSYIDTWEFVTACFTEQGCKDYLAINGHNLTDPRIYAEGSFRNREWQTVRDFLLSRVTP